MSSVATSQTPVTYTEVIQNFGPAFGTTTPDVISGNNPGILLSPSETNGEVQEIIEIAGSLWTATNAVYNVNTAGLTPNTWYQQNTNQPSYALQYTPAGLIVRWTAAATLTGTPTAITFVQTPFNFGSPAGQINTGYSFLRNRFINGNAAIDQRNNGASLTIPSGPATYTIDRWFCESAQASKISVQQNGGASTPPPGFGNYVRITSSSAYASLSTDYFAFDQKIEGYNTADWQFGSASALPVTLSGYIRASQAGVYSGALINGGANRSYTFTVTITAANTWQYFTVVIPGDQVGTWNTGNGTGAWIRWNLGSGSTYQTAAGAWTAGSFIAAPGSVQLVGTNAATLDFGGMQIETGSQATPFEQRLYGTELALCQRYCAVFNYTISNQCFLAGQAFSATFAWTQVQYPVPMRGNATFTQTGNFQYFTANGGGSGTAALVQGPNAPSGTVLQGTCPATLVAGNAAFLTSQPGNSQLIFSAEL